MVPPNAPALHLCATSRLAQQLRLAGDAAGGGAVLACTVGEWLRWQAESAVFDGHLPPLALLSAPAEKLLWEQVIGTRLPGSLADFFDLAGLAAQAADAHALCCLWGSTPQMPAGHGEGRHFLDWRREFRERAKGLGMIDAASQQQAVLQHLARHAGRKKPTEVRFLGFDRVTPMETRLGEIFVGQGVAVHLPPPLVPSPAPPPARRLVFADGRAECRAVAAWAAETLHHHPGARLGVVAPDLRPLRRPLADALDDALLPASLRPDGATALRPVNFSLGTPLAQQPVLAAALDLLALVQPQAVEQRQLLRALSTPFRRAGLAEADALGQLEVCLRQEKPALLRLADVLQAIDRHTAQGRLLLPHTRMSLLALLHAGRTLAGQKARAGLWRTRFISWLEACGWPGERALCSGEFQAKQAFLETLDQFAGLDELLGELRLPAALQRLRALLQERLFQPMTRGRPPVEVLGILESAGLGFDALWVMGLDEAAWPPAPRPNPLLPAAWQRALGMPRAAATGEAAFAASVQARLLAAAGAVCVSHAAHDGSRPRRASPLIAHWAEAPQSSPLPVDCPPLAAKPALEAEDDHQAPPVLPGESVRGGSALLRAQAICPAWAFYRYRLGAEALGQPVEGLDAMRRGTLVHAVLEHFWLETRSSERFLALSESAVTACLEAGVAEALTGLERETGQPLPPRFRALEAARLMRLARTWLAHERGREQAFCVHATESTQTLTLGGVNIRLTVDRIDRLDDGRLLIIDYKTGEKVETKNWSAERLSEPQLPLYAALAVPAGERVAGVAFAKVRLDEPGFYGIAEQGGLLPGVRALDDPKQKVIEAGRFADWPALIDHWRERLLAIAGEIAAGHAAVAVADDQALRYCDVLPLLRLPELRAQTGFGLANESDEA